MNEWFKWKKTNEDFSYQNKQLINENNKLKLLLDYTSVTDKWNRIFDNIKLNHIISIIKHIGLYGKKLNALHLFTIYSQIQTNKNQWNDLIKRFREFPKPISLTITHQKTKTNVYQDIKISSNRWKYFSDYDGQNKEKICKGAHLYHRYSRQFTFIGIVSKIIEISRETIFKNGEPQCCAYYILEIINMCSLGTKLEPNTKVPIYNNGGRGSARYMMDTARASGIEELHTSPYRGILY